MNALLLLMGLCLLVHSSVCSPDAGRGCLQWEMKGTDVCCQSCHPGNKLVKKCGPDPRDLCKPCTPGTYTVNPRAAECDNCTECIDPKVTKEQCTATRNTVCDCKRGLVCVDHACSSCIEECGKGQEPTGDNSCRPCPHGNYNDQIHKKCKPWSTRCPYPHQVIVTTGDVFSDIKCENISVRPEVIPEPKDPSLVEWSGPSTLIIIFGIAFTFLLIIIIVVGLINVKQKKPLKKQTPMKKTIIISNPTDEPRTLIPIECSFHEAEQEQGTSSESLLP